jgi:hypothetical protein
MHKSFRIFETCFQKNLTGAKEAELAVLPPIFLKRKSSKTGECAAFARLAAFSFQNEERAFQRFEMAHDRVCITADVAS